MSILVRIGELRKQHEKLSINKLEQECGLTRGSMAKWDDHAPSPDKVKKVADYFNVSVEYLLYDDPSAGIKKERPADGEARVCDLPESIQKIINICLDRPELASALLTLAQRLIVNRLLIHIRLLSEHHLSSFSQ